MQRLLMKLAALRSLFPRHVWVTSPLGGSGSFILWAAATRRPNFYGLPIICAVASSTPGTRRSQYSHE
jgi:hypothetical protein